MRADKVEITEMLKKIALYFTLSYSHHTSSVREGIGEGKQIRKYS
jgi:hypothetical protein